MKEKPCENWPDWFYGYEYKVLQEKIRKARTLHICDECQNFIYPEEEYLYRYLLYEGDPMEEKVCEYCIEERKILAEFNIYPPFGKITETWLWAWRKK